MSILSTQIFYIFIMFVSAIFAFLSQHIYRRAIVSRTYYDKTKKSLFIIAFIIPCVVMAFTNIGSDYESYYNIINRLTWSNYASFTAEEPGVNFFFLIIRTVACENVDVAIFIIKILTGILFFISFYIAKNEIKIGYSVVAYLLLLYLPSFYLLTIALATAIVSIGMSLLFFKNKKIVSFFLILLAAQLHNSAYIFIPVYLGCILIRGKATKIKKVIFALGYIMAILSGSVIYSYIQSTVPGFHYNNYGTNSFSGSGIMVIVLYVPLLVLMYYIFVLKNLDDIYKDYVFVFVLSDILFYVLSYQFRVIERMSFYIIPLYTMLIPHVLKKIDEKKTDKKFLTFSTLELVIIIYVLFRGVLVFIQRTTILSGVGHYQFFNPFI